MDTTGHKPYFLRGVNCDFFHSRFAFRACEYHQALLSPVYFGQGNGNVIKVFYCSKDRLDWVFESDIPHETFLTYDGGYDEEFADFDEGFARCMVFELSALKG